MPSCTLFRFALSCCAENLVICEGVSTDRAAAPLIVRAVSVTPVTSSAKSSNAVLVPAATGLNTIFNWQACAGCRVAGQLFVVRKSALLAPREFAPLKSTAAPAVFDILIVTWLSLPTSVVGKAILRSGRMVRQKAGRRRLNLSGSRYAGCRLRCR